MLEQPEAKRAKGSVGAALEALVKEPKSEDNDEGLDDKDKVDDKAASKAMVAKAMMPPPPPPPWQQQCAKGWRSRGGWFSKAQALAEQVLQDEGASPDTRALAALYYAGPDAELGK